MDDELIKLGALLKEGLTITNIRIDKLKNILVEYLSMANDFALSSLKTSLKEI